MPRKPITRALVALVLVACVAGVALLAFSGSDESSGGTKNAAAGTAKSGGTLVYAVPAVPEILDSFPYGGDGTRWLNITLNSQLIDYDTSKLQDAGCGKVASSADVRGNLAESYTVSPDRSSITLKLHDTRSAYGNPLTAEDVKWSFARILALGSFMANTLGANGHYDLDDFVNVVDPHTVRINIKQPFSFEVALLTNNLLTVWDSTEARKHATAKDPWATKWMATHTADFGPWQLESFTPGSEIILKRNPNYTLTRGNVDRVVMRAVPDSSVRTQLLTAGDADITARLSYDEYKQLTTVDGVKVQKCVSPNRDYLILNHKEPALSKPDVRRAISLAIDRQALVDSAYQGYGAPARYGLSQFIDFPKPAESGQLQYDPEKAKQLLAAAGYPDGFQLNLLYSAVRPGSVVMQSAPVIQSMLAKVGIKVKLRNVAGGTDFYKSYSEGNYEAVLYSEGSPLSDPTYSASTFLKTGGNDNTFGYSSKQFDKTLADAKALTVGPEQQKLLAQLSQISVDDVSIVFLVDQASVVPMRSSLSGYQARPQGEVVPSDLSKG
ncbi:MAG TPA: ABC transporter substrate-binding protein [Solirubrobacter sp.]|nr:ABC transporter substrate-binding protein [Solirubrobacter sp.]